MEKFSGPQPKRKRSFHPSHAISQTRKRPAAVRLSNEKSRSPAKGPGRLCELLENKNAMTPNSIKTNRVIAPIYFLSVLFGNPNVYSWEFPKNKNKRTPMPPPPKSPTTPARACVNTSAPKNNKHRHYVGRKISGVSDG